MQLTTQRTTTRVVPRTTVPDERGARRCLRQQIARLEEELAGLFGSAWRSGYSCDVGAGGGGARVLGLGELEALRDALSDRVRAAKEQLADGAAGEEESRRLIEEILLDPGGHRWTRVTNQHIGEPGCRNWHVRPKAGLLGMLMGWWRVVLSSGCP